MWRHINLCLICMSYNLTYQLLLLLKVSRRDFLKLLGSKMRLSQLILPSKEEYSDINIEGAITSYKMKWNSIFIFNGCYDLPTRSFSPCTDGIPQQYEPSSFCK